MRIPYLSPTSLGWLIDVHQGKVAALSFIPWQYLKALRRPGEELVEHRYKGRGKPVVTLMGRYVIAGARAADAMEGMCA